MYDFHWGKINKTMLNQEFGGAVFIGDTHFQTFEHETGLQCHTPITGAVGKRRDDIYSAQSKKGISMNKRKPDPFVKVCLER